jgi:AtzE family amidohydrolase
MTDPLSPEADAVSIAAAVAARQVTATAVVDAALARIAAGNERINAFVEITATRARAEAQALDRALDGGAVAAALAGVPFAVKGMIDLEGVTTTAGSLIYRSRPPASRDAAVVRALRSAGAICLGTTNMDEFGLGGTTENSHYGVTRNPHDPDRTPGGSSGGAAAAIAAGFVPIALGGDGLGSIRLPASLCGVFGLRPTLGLVSLEGIRGSDMSLGTVGPLTRSARDLDVVFNVISERASSSGVRAAHLPGHDAGDLRFVKVSDYFEDCLDADAISAWQTVCRSLGATKSASLPEAARACAAAMIINLAENGRYQLDDLRKRYDDFDPKTRDRLLAGALAPAAWHSLAKQFERWYRDQMLQLFRNADVLVTPATPCVAPPIGSPTIYLAGVERPTGPTLGMLTQPIALTGCPSLTVPVSRPGHLPIGVQLVAAPGHEDKLFQAAVVLEREGVCRACLPVDKRCVAAALKP